ncbi:family 78 glycoside hydrolase catalytic domain [Paenibacillus sedimenti]|uniref:Family 78 glycoside hydrolase catalytic domain n=1 Tax=Paenibacillus sedimenti TaxID=2770274 RepID=A0A926KPR0_9BACL|nr:family 78 glycoside hydrolase catalytic domain [Paenibacillus sedimenti]MBD0380896.1 family 78 glycoside hydrolase catalytic domain [Paenibacillus sedimenti]
MGQQEINWKAQWIWGGNEESPRNEWRCFRNTFRLPSGRLDGAALSLTADSRYVLYVNGERVGRGPVRSWPFELAYDTYDVGHLLKPGKENIIAVMVLHYGITNFYYLRGRGGLLAQLEVNQNGIQSIQASTDEGWKTSLHLGHDPRSPRMSCQHGFVERVDARLWPEGWVSNDYNDQTWGAATVIGEAGDAPWTTLVPRDIPLLTEEPIYPLRVESLQQVKPISWSTNIDMRNQMMPESTNHANFVGKIGYVATVVRVSSPVKATFGFLNSRFNFGPCSINGTWYSPEQLPGEFPQKFVVADLKEGDNFFLMDVTGVEHGDGFHMGIDCEEPFELISPWPSDEHSSPFITIGPYAVFERIDHKDVYDPIPRFRKVMSLYESGNIQKGELTSAEAAYLQAKSISSASELAIIHEWIRPIPNALVSRDNVFALSIWKREAVSHKVPSSMQNVVIAHVEPALIPLFGDADTEIILDFEKEYSGYIEFEADAAEGTVLDFYGFEYMHEGWRQDTYRLDNTMRYTCREGRQRYVSLVRRGLRYLMITVRSASRPVKLYEVKLRQSNYPIAEIGRFHSSDALLNDIWRISQHTTRVCMEDTFVDCPAYEQTFWVGDSRNEALINYYMFGATDIVKRCLKLVPGSKFQTPLFADQVPSGWSSVIPNWTFFWAIACSEYVEHTGDIAFAEEMWPHVRFTLDHYLTNLDSKGLLFMRGWNFLDWAPIDQPGHGAVSHQNMFLVKTLREASMLAEIAGDMEGAHSYRAASLKLAQAINTHLWSEEHKAYIDCIHADGRPSSVLSMQTQVVAFLSGVADKDRKRQIEAHLAFPPEHFVQIGSAFMSFFYYEALSQIGLTEIMVEDIRKNYGTMVKYESSTCYEGYPKLIDGQIHPRQLTRSHCHAWSAAPGYFLGHEILGVRRAAPGWAKIVIAPKPIAGLTWAKGTVPLPQGGRVDVSWSIREENKTMEIKASVPEGHEMEIIAPTGYRLEILPNALRN